MLSAIVHPAQFPLLFIRKLWLLSAQLPLGARDRHSFSCPHPDQITLELREGGEDVKEHLTHWVGRIINARTKCQPHPTRHQRVGNGPRVRNRPRQPVEFRDDKCVSSSNGR